MNPLVYLGAFVAAAVAITWMSYAQDAQLGAYIARCAAENGHAVSMRISNNKSWLQCVRGLDIVRLLPDDERLP